MTRLLLLLALLLCPCALPAQPTSATGARADTQAVDGGADPAAAANGYYGAFKAGDWNRAAGFIHPRTLAAMRAVVDSGARKDRTGMVLPMLMGVQSTAELKALSDREVYVRFLARQLAGDEARAYLDAMTVEVTNVTLENPDLARVTTVTREGAKTDPPETVPVLRINGRWFLLLDLDP